MARFPRTLGDALAAQAEAARSTRTETLSVDPLIPIDFDHLAPDLTDKLGELDTGLGQVDDKISQAISDANAIPLSDERFSEDSLSIWPFVQGLIPNGALAPGSVGAPDLADFVLTARKFNDDRHRLY